MSTFKMNYAGLKKSQIQDSFSNPSTSAATSNVQTSRTLAPTTPTSSQINSAAKKDSENSALLSLYQGSFQSDNLDYINLLLKNKATSNREKSQNANKKKGHIRTKSTFVDLANQNQKDLDSPDIIPGPKPELFLKKANDNDRPVSMRPENDDPFAVKDRELKNVNRSVDHERDDDEEFYDGNDTQRNLNNTPTKKEGKLFDRFFKDENVVKRSLSMEDLRIDKKGPVKNPNKSTMHNPAELKYFSMERSQEDGSFQQDSKQSNASGKSDFLTSLNTYLDYFQKSENTSYRNMKAGQYFRGNHGKSHRSMQKELEVSNQELRGLKNQVHELKWKVNDLTSGTKMLTKELKMAHARNDENQELFKKMQAEILHLKQKNRHYKTQCIQLQEAYRHERGESESKLIALKQVIANSINFALEQKSTPLLGKINDKPVNIKNIGIPVSSAKNKDKNIFSYMKENKNGTTPYCSFFDVPSNYKKSKDTPKKVVNGSVMFSPKISMSGSEEEEGQSFPDMNSLGYPGSYEGEDSQLQEQYQEAVREEVMKDQQIKFLKDQLAELESTKDDISRYNSHQKSTAKSSRDKQSYKMKHSLAITPNNNYYVTRDRQGSLTKLSNLSAKYEGREQRSSGMFREHEERHSNDGSERSFSMHNSD